MLAMTRGRKFAQCIQQHRIRLLETFTQAYIEKIEDEFRALQTAYIIEEVLKKQIDAGGENESFEAAWEPIQKTFYNSE